MSLILDYIYTGNVAIIPTILTDFVSAANLLQLQLDQNCLTKYLNCIPHEQRDKKLTYNDDYAFEINNRGARFHAAKSENDPQNEPSNFSSVYLENNVHCKKGRKIPNLMPINAFRRRKELFNKVFPSPWCQRISPILRDPREDCLTTAELPVSAFLNVHYRKIVLAE